MKLKRVFTCIFDFFKPSSFHEKCQICGAEGNLDENGPLMCSCHSKGLYCQAYLKNLKFNFIVYSKFRTELYKNKVEYSEIIDLLEEIESLETDRVYYYNDLKI